MTPSSQQYTIETLPGLDEIERYALRGLIVGPITDKTSLVGIVSRGVRIPDIINGKVVRR